MRLVIIFLEILVIILCIFWIFSKKNTESASFTLSAQNFTHNASSTFQYYIEPVVSTTIHNKPAWAQKESINTINADTLNERFDYPTKKEPGTFRIALLGDSFAFGLYVDTKSNFSELLEVDLNKNLKCSNITKVELINFGVPSYDLQYEVERYRLRAAKYNPDLVLWFMESGDLTLVNETFNKDELRYIEGKSDGTEAWKKARAEYTAKVSEATALTTELAALASFNSMYKGPMLVFSLPPLFDRPESNVVKSLTAALAARPHTLMNLTLAAPWKLEDQVLQNDAHPSEIGSLHLEKALLEYIQKQNLIPCQ